MSDKVGLHYTYIEQLEHGEKNATLETIQKIAGALQLPLEDQEALIELIKKHYLIKTHEIRAHLRGYDLMLSLLISQLDDDDRAFVLNLYTNYYSLVRKTVYSVTHDNLDIEDLITDVFINLIEKISTIRSLDYCKTASYVVYTTRNVSINYIKHNKVEIKHKFYSENMDTSEDYFNSEDGSEEILVRREEIEILNEAVSMLPQKEKDLLYFKYILQMSDKEIAEILEIAPNSVRQYLTRARRNAKKIMKKELGDYAK